jgi:hypothetical protein
MVRSIRSSGRQAAFGLSLRHGVSLFRSTLVTTVPPRNAARCAQWRSAAATPKVDPVRLAPSDFAFLWEECRRCFYLKAHKKLYRPRAPFPSIFSTIDLEMKRHMRGLRTTDVIPSMKPGVFLCEDNDAWVECTPIKPPGRSRSVFIRGMVRFLMFRGIAHNPTLFYIWLIINGRQLTARFSSLSYMVTGVVGLPRAI